MAKGKGKNTALKDPVEGSGEDTLKEELDAMGVEDAAEGFSFLKPDEIGTIKENRVRAPHPFDGYRLGRKITVGDAQISSTFVIVLNQGQEPPTDKSNLGVTVYVGGDGSGHPRGGGKRKVVDLTTAHTRVVTDRSGSVNETVVFDRDIILSDGQVLKCAIVKSHAARAQIMFDFDQKRNRIMPNKTYSMADKRQADRLYQMFRAIHYQRTRAEQSAKAFDAAEESTAEDKG